MPTKGLPLPFISYGGSALLINMAAVGILINISVKNEKSAVASRTNVYNATHVPSYMKRKR